MTQQNLLPVPDGQRVTAYPRGRGGEDEIDLIELFQTIWSQKAKIALVTLVTTLAAGIYAFTAEEVWTSKAVFDQPKLAEINEYYTVTQQLKRILQSSTIGDVALEPKKSPRMFILNLPNRLTLMIYEKSSGRSVTIMLKKSRVKRQTQRNS